MNGSFAYSFFTSSEMLRRGARVCIGVSRVARAGGAARGAGLRSDGVRRESADLGLLANLADGQYGQFNPVKSSTNTR